MNKNKITILIFLLLSSGILSAQKILFDNTKSEEAGNADWVIDHSEPEPYPDQSGISSSTSETYWDGAISAWGVEMVKRGFTVETLPSYRDISYGNSSNSQDLSNYDIFIICEPNNPFSSSEKTAIMNFVQNGGGLFMVADHESADRDNDGWSAYTAFNDLITNNSVDSDNAFGMLFTDDDFINDYPNHNMINDSSDPLLHGAAGDVSGMEFHGSAAMTIYPGDNSTVKGVVYRTGYSTSGTSEVMVAYSRYGQGKVVGLVDSSPADDGTGNSGDDLYYGWDEEDNGILITNATLWLADDSNSADELVSGNFAYVFPNPAENVLTVNTDTEIYGIKISDITGRECFSKAYNGRHAVLSLSGFNAGVYFVEIETSNKKILKKIVKR
ncbi:MAG: T9SS type A sorting domain-containing protein [Chlorobi bacterium]|nr:T9SS type A sorting domain-containing protein [Chlorobiota bacterium]